MEIFFGKKKDKEIMLPKTEYIYELLFTEILKKIKNLEIEYIYKSTNKFDDKKLIKKIETNINFLNILFNEQKTNSCINLNISIDNSGVPIEPLIPNEPSIQNIGIKQNQFVIFINYFETYWIICKIVKNWINAGGNLLTVDKKYIDKYTFIEFLNELYKGFSAINKTTINEKINTFIDLLDIKQKKRYYSFEIYLILKKKDLTTEDLRELKKYYDLGIDYTLLDEHKINRMFLELEKMYLDKDIATIVETDLEEYSKTVGDINNPSINKKEKINDYYKKYYVYKLNELLFSQDYINHCKEIFGYVNKLETIEYVLNSKQKKRLEIFKLKLNKINDFNKNTWFPLFTKEELDKMKSSIESNPDDPCKNIKKLFPFYKISFDYFCEKINPKTNKKLYNNQEDIYRTINTQCIIMLLVGIINYKLLYTKQDYQIIIKGGKALQLLLSKLYDEKKINKIPNYKSSDIDLIINPINGIAYDKKKCKILTEDFVNLVKWLINKYHNPYSYENYISSEQGREYQEIIKISHKIQKDNNTYHEAGFTAIADIDFGEKNHSMYDDLINDWQNSSKYGKLLYVYQNLNDYLLEKIYYLDHYIKELDKLIIKSKQPNVKLSKDEYKNFNNYERFIDKFSKQIIQIIKIEFDKKNLENNMKKYLGNFIAKNNIYIDVDKIMKFLN